MSEGVYVENLTLCWFCKNAVPNKEGTVGCSWSREFKPVKGWKARKCKNSNGDSYRVYECPELVRDADEDRIMGC